MSKGNPKHLIDELRKDVQSLQQKIVDVETRLSAWNGAVSALSERARQFEQDLEPLHVPAKNNDRGPEQDQPSVNRDVLDLKTQLTRAQTEKAVLSTFTFVATGLTVIAFGHSWYSSAQVEDRVKGIVEPAEKSLGTLKESLAAIKMQGAEHRASLLLARGYNEVALERNFDQAIEYARRALRELDCVVSTISDFPNLKQQVDRTRASTWLLLAESYKQLRNYDAVNDFADRILCMDPEQPEANAYKGVALLVLAQQNKDSERRRQTREEATKYLIKAISVPQDGIARNDSSKATINVAETFFMIGRFSDSQIYAQKYLSSSSGSDSGNPPRQPVLLVGVATAWKRMSDFALKGVPDLDPAKFLSDFKHVDWREFDPQVLEEFQQLNPDNPPGYLKVDPDRLRKLQQFSIEIIKKAKPVKADSGVRSSESRLKLNPSPRNGRGLTS